MAQTILTAGADVQPASAARLRDQLQALTARQEARPNPGDQAYDALRSAVPALHFMSITVADDDQYDPLLVIEANFDGPAAAFWPLLDAALGPDLRALLRGCKRPRDARGALFEAITQPGSQAPLAPLLHALTVLPAVQHQGNRGLSRARVIAEGKLFQAVQDALDSPAAPGGRPAEQIHQQLRAALLPQFAWLASPAPVRIPRAERLADLARGLAFVALLLVVFALSAWLLCQLANPLLDRLEAVWPGLHQHRLDAVIYHRPLKWALLTVLGALLIVPAAVLRLRQLERSDASNDAPRVDQAALREMARREDFITQNHMISIVHVKPGVLRMVLARLALRALGLLLRVSATNGYLVSMRTIHFAHWSLLDNGGRLMFHSNFDGSWESYLDDFIEKAHVGLTLAWTHGVGFPPTRFLTGGGATEGRKFKAWARHSMSQSGFWFSAYKQYSVNQIERHARLANGLRQATLTPQEASAWAIDL